MIGDVRHPNGDRKRPVRIALERTIVVYFYATVTVLIGSLPGLPSVEDLYAAALVGSLAGLGAYAIARQIQVAAPR